MNSPYVGGLCHAINYGLDGGAAVSKHSLFQGAFGDRAGSGCQEFQVGYRRIALQLVLHPIEGCQQGDQRQTYDQTDPEAHRLAHKCHGRASLISVSGCRQKINYVTFSRSLGVPCQRGRYCQLADGSSRIGLLPVNAVPTTDVRAAL